MLSIAFRSGLLAAALVSGSFGSAIAAGEESDREVYERVGCWGCHAYEGQGGRDGPPIAHTQHSYEAFSAFVRTTAGDMPPYTERVVSDADLRAIYAYLQSLPEPPQASTIPLLSDVFPD